METPELGPPPPADSPKSLPYLQVGAGVAIGILLMVFFQAFFAAPPSNSATSAGPVAAGTPEPGTPPTIPALTPTPNDTKTTAEPTDGKATSPTPEAPPGATPPTTPGATAAGTPPAGPSPEAGKAASKAPPPLKGSIGTPPLAVEPLSPTVVATPTVPPTDAPSQIGSSLIEVDLGGGGDSARGRIDAEVRKHRGTLRTVEVEGKRSLLVFVPPDRADLVLKASGGRVTTRWNGSSEERRARLTGDIARRVADLESRRKALLLRYFEDAIPVREVDEALEQAKADLRRLSPPPSADRMTAIHFALGD